MSAIESALASLLTVSGGPTGPASMNRSPVVAAPDGSPADRVGGGIR